PAAARTNAPVQSDTTRAPRSCAARTASTTSPGGGPSSTSQEDTTTVSAPTSVSSPCGVSTRSQSPTRPRSGPHTRKSYQGSARSDRSTPNTSTAAAASNSMAPSYRASATECMSGSVGISPFRTAPPIGSAPVDLQLRRHLASRTGTRGESEQDGRAVPERNGPVFNASVGAELHGGPVVRLVVVRHVAAGVDCLGAALRHVAYELGRRRRRGLEERGLAGADHAEPGVLLQPGAGVGDVEVAHGELADPVHRAERRVLRALHRELVGVVAEGRARGVEDRVVLAAPQPERDLAGDGGADPALQRLAEHQRLRVEPAALVHEPAETAALVVVVRQRVLVVNRVDQSLVRD